MSDKQKTIEVLRETGDKAITALRGQTAESFEAGRYESGWNGRQILAHIAAIEWTYARLVDLARESTAEAAPVKEAARTTPEQAPDLPQRPPRGGINDYNARQVEKRADATVAELIDEFAANRQRTIDAVQDADDALFEKPIRSAGGITGTLGQVINAVAIDHVMSHVADITGEPWSGTRW